MLWDFIHCHTVVWVTCPFNDVNCNTFQLFKIFYFKFYKRFYVFDFLKPLQKLCWSHWLCDCSGSCLSGPVCWLWPGWSDLSLHKYVQPILGDLSSPNPSLAHSLPLTFLKLGPGASIASKVGRLVSWSSKIINNWIIK